MAIVEELLNSHYAYPVVRANGGGMKTADIAPGYDREMVAPVVSKRWWLTVVPLVIFS